MSTSELAVSSSLGANEAAPTLLEAPPRPLGLRDQVVLWWNLGVTLTIPVAAAFVLQPFPGLPPLSLGAAVTAITVGAVLGSIVLGWAAVPGAETGAPAMVLLRGLLGRRGSWVPTALNVAQCVGWAAVEILIIGNGAARIFPSAPRVAFLVAAGVAATALAVRPLGFIRELRKYAVWLVLAASAYLFFQVLRRGIVPPPGGAWAQFWPAVDLVVALPISWAPLAADFARHSRTPRKAFGGAAVGFGLAAIAYFLLGVFAVTAIPGAAKDPIGALLSVQVGVVAVAVLVLDELDEAFANLYSTALSAQNVRPSVDRRTAVIAVGVVATLLALALDVTQYESFLFLIGSVFVPLFAVLLVDYFVLGRRRGWDVGPDAPGRPLMAVPWILGFVAYQLLNPGTVPGWSDAWRAVQDALGFTPPLWASASIGSFLVAGAATLVVGPLDRRRAAARATA
ncbi:MAG TPA: cytosine permease [Anaeromyxobacter sp.]|nr:cytosine permease [Anaeromyxobacter sp.]